MAEHGRWQQESLRRPDPMAGEGNNGFPDWAGGPGAAVPPTEPAASGWRAEIRTASGLNLLAGIWLIISPFVLGYLLPDTVWNPIGAGALILLLALARVSGAYRERWLSGVNALIGLWLIASAFVLADSGQAEGNVGFVGLIVFLLAIWSVGVTPRVRARA